MEETINKKISHYHAVGGDNAKEILALQNIKDELSSSKDRMAELLICKKWGHEHSRVGICRKCKKMYE